MASRRGIVRPPGFVVDLHGAVLRRVDVSDGDLQNANLADADLSDAKLRGVDFSNANLKGTILRGADLREARNLTWQQLSEAVIDASTRLPDYLQDRQPATEG
jgi:uncharacterized protein YjbI with pentapeptide repeats